tara:strand:+ start:83 stop:745 length:663 start_codon:yes stop_codon:yes gene_type:complete
MKNKKVFIAVDTSKIKTAKKIIQQTRTNKIKIGYKFGLEFLNSKNGRNFVSKLKNKVVFVDAKLNDIPNTMVSTIKALRDIKIDYLTVHISSGLIALKNIKKISRSIKIIGVTVLTSLDNDDLRQIGYSRKVKDLVIHQAKLARKAKLDAIVCSPYEVKEVRKVFKKEIITPGIKLNDAKNDQKRAMHPKNVSSDWIVVGRSITKGNIKYNIQKLISQIT